MPPSPAEQDLVHFGLFEVDLRSGELRKQGRRVRLQEKPFQILTLLPENAGQLVTREQLREKLWPPDVFVDFDHSLNAAVKRLRDGLGESAEKPVFIETLAGRGYRFIAPVSAASVKAGDGRVVFPEASKRPFLRPKFAITLLSALVIGILLWALWGHPWRRAEIVERKLTANLSENSVTGAAVSRDGKFLAYTERTGIYLKHIRTGETHRVPLPPNFSADVDDWFPDGSHLLVTRQEQPVRRSLWSVSLFGGSPRQLARDAFGGAVSPDGFHIAFRRVDFGREEWVMRSDGADPIKVAGDNAAWMGRPTWSPDGNRIAYVRTNWSYYAGASSVQVNEWRNARAETLFSDSHLGPALHWLSDGRLIYRLSDESSRQSAGLWIASIEQARKISLPAKRIAGAHGWISQVTGSDDGRVVIFLQGNLVPNVYLGALAPDGTHVLAHRRLTLDENENAPFAWTPDSKAVIFNSDRNGTLEIFKQVTDQPLAESLIASQEQLSQPRMTPDGSEVLYISTPKSDTPATQSSIFAIPVDGGTPRLVLKDVRIWNVQCARLPSTLCMYSRIKGDSSETFRFDVRTGKRSDPPQVDPQCNWGLSPDGLQRAIIPATVEGTERFGAVATPKATIRFRSTLTGDTRDLLIEGWNELGGIDWAADGKSLLVSANTHEPETALLRVALDGRVSVLLRSSSTKISFAIPSPDGRSLAIAEAASSNNAWAIENF